MSTAVATIVDVELDETGWRPQGNMSFEQWEAAGRELMQMGRAWQWWVGDWVLYGEQNYGEKYAQAIELTGMEYGTLANVISVARKVDSSRRREDLSWSHHVEVAPLPPREQDKWLDRAREEGMTLARLRSSLSATKAGRVEPGDDRPTEAMLCTIRLTVDATSTDDAREQLKRIGAAVERAGGNVTHKEVA